MLRHYANRHGQTQAQSFSLPVSVDGEGLGGEVVPRGSMQSYAPPFAIP